MRPKPRLLHARQHALHRFDRGQHVDVDGAPPDLDRMFVEFAGRRPAGIGDQNMDRSELALHGLDDGGEPDRLGDIALHEDRALAELASAQRPRPFRIAAIDRDAHARAARVPKHRQSPDPCCRRVPARFHRQSLNPWLIFPHFWT